MMHVRLGHRYSFYDVNSLSDFEYAIEKTENGSSKDLKNSMY